MMRFTAWLKRSCATDTIVRHELASAAGRIASTTVCVFLRYSVLDPDLKMLKPPQRRDSHNRFRWSPELKLFTEYFQGPGL